MNAAEKAVAQTLRTKGKGYKEIAHLLGKSATAVGNAIRSGGVAKKLGRPQKVSHRRSDLPPPRPYASPQPARTFSPQRRFFMRSAPAAESPRRSRRALIAHINLSPTTDRSLLRVFCVPEVSKRSGDAFVSHMERLQRRADAQYGTPKESPESRFAPFLSFIFIPKKSPSPLARLSIRFAPLVLLQERAVPFRGRFVSSAKSPESVTPLKKTDKV